MTRCHEPGELVLLDTIAELAYSARVPSQTDDLRGNAIKTAEAHEGDIGRRDWTKILAGLLGAAGVAACTSETSDGEASAEIVSKAVSTDEVIVCVRVAVLPQYVGSPNQVAVTMGFTGPFDGAGGLWVWDAGDSTSPTNWGTVIQATGTAQGRWKRVYSGPVDIRWFGASPARADNVLAIQRAIDAAPGTGTQMGRAVFIPEGSFAVATTILLRRGTTLIGTGPSSEIVFSPTSAIPCLQYTIDQTAGAGHDNQAEIVLDRFQVRSTNNTGTAAVHLISAYVATLRSLSLFQGWSTSSILLTDNRIGRDSTNCAMVVIDACRISNSAGDGIRVADDVGAACIEIRGCHLQSSSGFGINVTSSVSHSIVKIHHNTIEGNGAGEINLDGVSSSSVENNALENTKTGSTPLISLSARNTFYELSIVDNNMNGTVAPSLIRLQGMAFASYHLTVARNTMANCVGAAIDLSDLGPRIDGCTIEGNMNVAGITKVLAIAPQHTGVRVSGRQNRIALAISGSTVLTDDAFWLNQIIEFTGNAPLGTVVTVPRNGGWHRTLFNSTASPISVITAGGSGPTIVAGKAAVLTSDGVNVRRVTQDA